MPRWFCVGITVFFFATFFSALPSFGDITTQQRDAMLASGKVGLDLIDALDTASRVQVMISFSAVEPRGSLNLSSQEGQLAVRQKADELLTLVGDELNLTHRFLTVDSLAGAITSEGVLLLIDHPSVRRIDADVGGSATLVEAIPLADVDQVQGMGYTGDGVTVAVIDSGFDSDHPDLSDDLDGEQCYCSTNCCPDGNPSQSGAGSAEDDHGHGTNVSGIFTSNGTVAPLGAAPDAKVVAVKVLDSGGAFSTTADIVSGLDWIIANRPDVDLINMSIGTTAMFTGDCDNATAWTQTLATAINTLRTNGVLSFVSSGNAASSFQMSAPACIANSISVAAVYDSNMGSIGWSVCTDLTTAADQITCFSNTNSVVDLAAPGALTVSTGMGGGTSTMGGTSQASPLACACAALLLEARSISTPAEIESALESTGVGVTDPDNMLTFPRVDCDAALAQVPVELMEFSVE